MFPVHTHFLDLAKEIQAPDKGILGRTLFNDDRLKTVLFGFAQSEELSGTPLDARRLGLSPGRSNRDAGRRHGEGKPGTWVHMPTGVRHNIQAKTPVVMLLMLLK